jgi:glycosyltransferase involved in cell wall biosynthesis
MRIAVIAPPWAPVPPRLYGGIETVVDRQAVGLQAAGHDVVLFTTGDSTCAVPRRSFLPVAQGWRIGMSVPEVLHVSAAYDAIARLGFDVVHDHTVLGPFFAHRCPEVPVVVTAHNPLEGEWTQLFTRIAEEVPVIAISHAQVAAMPQIKPARVIHHGVDAADFPVGSGGGAFVFLGRMSPDKGAHSAMEAAHKAGARLVLAGKMRDRAEYDYFEQNVQPYLNENLVYAGEVPHEEKLELLAAAPALLFPIQWNEPFGMVMIEAMACGTPVIAFAQGAAPEVVRHGVTGMLCHDVDGMVEAMRGIGEIDRGTCRAAVEGYFSTARMVAEHIELYEELIASRASGLRVGGGGSAGPG